MKGFKNRWYVIAKDLKDGNVKTFALDRLTNFEITNRKFEYLKDYNIEENYRYCFGIINPNNEEPQNILLSFDPFQGKYIKSLPLHETQQIVIDNEEELQIKLKLCVTQDLVMELLSFGDDLKVLNPKSLADEIKKAHHQAFKQY
jgi:proteasome accessory factor B